MMNAALLVVVSAAVLRSGPDSKDGRLLPALLPLLREASPLQVSGGVARRTVLSTAAAAAAAAPLQAFAADGQAVPKSKVGVTPGGVKYFDKEPGSCSPFNPCVPQSGDFVKIKYKAYLSSGKMFDSSEGPGRKPLAAKFGSGQLLPGWEEALATMEQGSTRVIQVPPALAYGDKGIKIENNSGETEYLVPPGETLQYELTLVQVSLPPP